MLWLNFANINWKILAQILANMYLSSSPEESGAEPCLRCSSMTVFTCLSIVFTCQELRILACEGQVLWGMLRLEFVKSNFQGKKSGTSHWNQTEILLPWKLTLGVRTFPTNPTNSLGHACTMQWSTLQDPSAGHRANGRARSSRVVLVWSSDQACPPCSAGIMLWFQKGAHLSSGFVLCWMYRLVCSLLWAFWKCSLDILACSFTQRTSLGTWKGRRSFSVITEQCHLSLNTLLAHCWRMVCSSHALQSTSSSVYPETEAEANLTAHLSGSVSCNESTMPVLEVFFC